MAKNDPLNSKSDLKNGVIGWITDLTTQIDGITEKVGGVGIVWD